MRVSCTPCVALAASFGPRRSIPGGSWHRFNRCTFRWRVVDKAPDWLQLHRAPGIDLLGVFNGKSKRLEELAKLAWRQVSPRPGRNALDQQRAEPDAAEVDDLDPNRV